MSRHLYLLCLLAAAACAPRHSAGKADAPPPSDPGVVDSGRETHGGDPIAALFVAKGYHVYEVIAARTGDLMILNAADLERFRAALGDARVDPIEGPFADSVGDAVAARTGDDPLRPGSKLIELDRAKWEHSFAIGEDVFRTVFHEYLWAAGFDDLNYRISNRLGQVDPPRDGIGAWTPLPTAGAPRFSLAGDRVATNALWAGGRFVVIDTGTSTSCAAPVKAFTYDPSANAWTTFTAPPDLRLVPGASSATFGARVAIWGGGCRDAADGALAYSAAGALFDPATGAWEALPDGGPSPRAQPQLVNVAGRLAVWGGVDTSGQKVDGAFYDPATSAWAKIAGQGAPPTGDYGAVTSLETQSALFGKLLVWRRDNKSCAPAVLAYDPAAAAWNALSSASAPTFPCDWQRTIFTGTRFAFVFDDRFRGADGKDAAGVIWDPSVDVWSTMTANGAPPHREGGGFVWTGFGLVGFGGRDADGTATRDGAAYLTSSDEWKPLHGDRSPLERFRPSAVWTGDAVYIWGGLSMIGNPMATGAYWRP